MEGADQKPFYYVSHALKGTEARYTEVEKIALALVTIARKLRPYFLSHPITVLTNSPIGRILTQPDISGRLVKWTVELGEYDIEYQPRTTIKAQALTDFLAETLQNDCEEVWNVYVDGAANKEGSGVGAVIISPSGEKMKLKVKLDFRASNNEAEYETVLIGLRAARDVGVVRVVIYSDSQLVAQQVKGSYEAKNEKFVKYLKAIKDISEHFIEWSVVQIAREENVEADSLAKMATSLTTFSSKEVVRHVELSHSYELPTQSVIVNSWMVPILEYICFSKFPEDRAHAIKIKKPAPRFALVGDVLYQRSFTEHLLRCLDKQETEYVLKDIHEGCCGNHLGAVALARKTL